jgi:hypothetical protein
MTAALIEEILKKEGPMLSSDLSKLIEKTGVNPGTARKRVERGCEGMTRLSHIVFAHRARFVYLQSDYGSPRFFDNLMHALQKTGSTYFHALKALEMRDNVMPLPHFLVACGAPVAQKGHVSAKSLTERLVKATLIKEVVIAGGETYVVRTDCEGLVTNGQLLAELKGRLIAERIALIAVRDWARNLGLVSYDAVATREDLGSTSAPRVASFEWDLAGPSYLFPMRGYEDEKIKPGFLVCDIALCGRISEDQIGAFIKKCVSIRSLPRVGKCLQVFVAHAYSREAFARLKTEGIIPASTESLFGHDVAKALKQLCGVLVNTAKLVENPEALEKIFNDLSRIEGAASTLRGSLFELAVAQIAQWTFPGYLMEMNKIVRDSIGASAEIDIFFYKRNHELVFIECKGIHPMSTVDDAEVKKWLDVRISVIRAFVKSHSEWSKLTQRYEMWTSGRFSELAIAMVCEKQAQSPKLTIEIRDADYVLSQAKASNDQGLIRTYTQHFVNHPMQEFTQKKEREERRARKTAAREPKPPTPPPFEPLLVQALETGQQ